MNHMSFKALSSMLFVFLQAELIASKMSEKMGKDK